MAARTAAVAPQPLLDGGFLSRSHRLALLNRATAAVSSGTAHPARRVGSLCAIDFVRGWWVSWLCYPFCMGLVGKIALGEKNNTFWAETSHKS